MLLMKNYFDAIKLKLKKQVEIEELVIIDNSHKHKGHKFFSPEKRLSIWLNRDINIPFTLCYFIGTFTKY